VSRLFPERREARLEPDGLEALRDEVSAWRGRIDLTVVLSNHFARYTVVQPQDGATPEEELALARFQFARIHGERTKAWEVRLSRAGSGARLACAIDTALLDGVKACMPKHGRVRLVSVQPYLMAAYNRARSRIPREGAWLLLTEKGRACLARLAAKGWASVHYGAEADGEQLIERERSRAGDERLPSLVLKLGA
jgi:hypothetical protein